ncbi:hypothetical protein K32_39820 [Kaistia sp. 32K]|uniref:hypothetical protein n=1 Tax=Kaistia sp. 32K TaxID=2795690 RepID=UPI001916376D|nr:hypothetical protein [Kaistia sp. 32K]BCP55365.1 hypothetical protein K32_39820 [Kaistia sp. 32K]
MLKQTIMAAATTLVLVTGVLGASTGSALAWHRGEPHRNYDRGWDDRGWDNGRGHGWGRGHRVCRPEFRERRVWRHGRWEWRKVQVGERCYWTQGRGPRW